MSLNFKKFMNTILVFENKIAATSKAHHVVIAHNYSHACIGNFPGTENMTF